MVRSRAVRRFRKKVINLVEIWDTAQHAMCVSNACKTADLERNWQDKAKRTDKMEKSLNKDISCRVCHVHPSLTLALSAHRSFRAL